MKNDNITTVFDATDIETVEAFHGHYESKDDRRNKKYGSTQHVWARVRFNAELGRDGYDYGDARNRARDAFVATLIKELEGPFELVRGSDCTGYLADQGCSKHGFTLGCSFQRTASRPKEIMTELEWRELLPIETIRDAAANAAIEGAEYMVEQIKADLEEQSVVRISAGIRDWAEKKARKVTRYKARRDALEAEFKAEMESQAEDVIESLKRGCADDKDGQEFWDNMTPAARALVLEAALANQLTYRNGGWGLNTHLDSKLKERLDELRQEHAH